MAHTAEQARHALRGTVKLAEKKFGAFWKKLPDDPVKARDALMDELPNLADTHGGEAASLAADRYDDVRDDAGARGKFRAEPAKRPDDDRYQALARWGVGPLFADQPDWQSAKTLVFGGLQRDISDMHRQTIVNSSVDDKAAMGWHRVGHGDFCDFCRMLIDRGNVYTDKTVEFRSHDWCECSADPEFGKGKKTSEMARNVSQKNRSDETKAKENQAVKDYIKQNYHS